jgi:hypothetical protein
MRTITDDYGAEFAAHSDSLAYRTIGIYVLPVDRHLFARSRKSDRARAEAASRIRSAAPGRTDEARLCGARRRRLSRCGQGEHPRPAEETAAANRYGG